MTRQIYYTVTAQVLDGPKKTFFCHPDFRLDDDARDPEEIALSARNLEGKNGVKEVAISYCFHARMDREYHQIRRAAIALVRRDFQVASDWDVDVEVVHRIVLYKM